MVRKPNLGRAGRLGGTDGRQAPQPSNEPVAVTARRNAVPCAGAVVSGCLGEV